jgi:DNA gyrase subunit B
MEVSVAKAMVYNEASIKAILEDHARVRLKPAMYLGDEPIFRCLIEGVDNSVDEWGASGGFKSKEWDIYIRYDRDPTNKKDIFVVADRGRGIPVGKNKETKLSTLTTVLTVLHAGGKFDNKAYKSSRGTHGVGIAAANAVSEVFEAWTHRDGVWYHQKFNKGKPVTDVKKCVLPSEFKKIKSGTILKFIPDTSITQIKKSKISAKTITDWLENSAIIESPIRFMFEHKGKQQVFHQPEGPAYMVKRKLSTLGIEGIGKPLILATEGITLACQWGNTDVEEFEGYVNGLLTPNGGTHLKGFQTALTEAFNSVSTKKLKLADLKCGLLGFLNVKLSGADYAGQTKDKLMSPIAEETAAKLIDPLKKWFLGNKSMVKQIYQRAVRLREARKQVSQIMKAASSVKEKTTGALLPGILTTADSKTPPHERELFLLEGDSAGGTAKDARDRMYQEVLCLSGKPLNAARKTLARTLSSKPVQNILGALGVDIKHFKKGESKITFRVGRVYLLPDPDHDGCHICNLVLTTMYVLIPQVFELGMVYVVDAPLYFGTYKEKKYYGYTLKEVQSKTPSGGLITRMKGWGECPVPVLEEIAFNPATRRTFKVMPVKGKDSIQFMKIVGDNTQTRKEILGISLSMTAEED